MEKLRYLIKDEGINKEKRNDIIVVAIFVIIIASILGLVGRFLLSGEAELIGKIISVVMLVGPIIYCMIFYKGANQIREGLNHGDPLLELLPEGIRGISRYGTKFFVKWDNVDEIYIEKEYHPLFKTILSFRRAGILRLIMGMLIPIRRRRVVISLEDLRRIDWEGSKSSKDSINAQGEGLGTYDLTVLGKMNWKDMVSEMEDYMRAYKS